MIKNFWSRTGGINHERKCTLTSLLILQRNRYTNELLPDIKKYALKCIQLLCLTGARTEGPKSVPKMNPLLHKINDGTQRH